MTNPAPTTVRDGGSHAAESGRRRGRFPAAGLVLAAAAVGWSPGAWSALVTNNVTVTTPFPKVGESFLTEVSTTVTDTSVWGSTVFVFQPGLITGCSAVPEPGVDSSSANPVAFVPVQSTQTPTTAGTYDLTMAACNSPDCSPGSCTGFVATAADIEFTDNPAGGQPGLGSGSDEFTVNGTPTNGQTLSPGLPGPPSLVPSLGSPGDTYDEMFRYGNGADGAGGCTTTNSANPPTTCPSPPPDNQDAACYDNTYVQCQSGLGYEGYNAVPFSCDADEAIPIGVFTHFNNPIFAGSALTGGVLNITLFDNNQPTNNVDFPCPDPGCGKPLSLVGIPPNNPPGGETFAFGFEETPNTAGTCAYNPPYPGAPPGSDIPCNDRVTILNAAASSEPVKGDDGTFCEVALLGFAPCQDPADPESLDLSDEFVTVEGTQNNTCLWVAPGTPVPVTLSSVLARIADKQFTVDWTTASEINTVGFILWAKVGGLWYQLNDDVIPTNAFNSAAAQDYRRQYPVAQLPGRIQAYGLTTLEVDGREYFYGPFKLRKRYGDASTPPPIPWAGVREELKVRMELAGLRWDGERWVAEDPEALSPALSAARGLASLPMAADGTAGGPGPAYDLRVEESGMVRVNAGQVPGLVGAPIDEIAIVDSHGQPVPRFVKGRRGKFASRGYIDFFAEPLAPADALYTDENVYRVVVDSDLAVNPVTVRTRPRDLRAAPITSAEHLLLVDDNKRYSIGMPTGSPWYDDERIVTRGKPSTMARTLTLDHLVPGGAAWLQLGLGGMTDFKGVDPDHHVQVLVNGELVADEREDGAVDWRLQVELPAGLLQAGDNDLDIVVTGDTGYPVDYVALDTYGIAYERNLVARDNGLLFRGDVADAVYQVSGLGSRSVGYAWKDGVLYRLVRLRTVTSDGAPALRFKGVPVDGAEYWVSTAAGMRDAKVAPVAQTGDLLEEAAGADFLILAHSSFIGDALNAYVERRSDDGYRPKVIDVRAVYSQFSAGMPVPRAIRAFLDAAAQVSDYEHVLLVGGACSDPLNYLGKDCVDFIPTMYTPTGKRTFFTPTDALLVSFDGQSAAAKAIGRWPVRTLAELETIIDKTIKFDDKGLASQASALLIADKRDQSGLSFEIQAEAIGRELVAMQEDGSAWPWPLDDGDRVILSDYAKVKDAREDMISRLSEGPAMTVFSGHGAPGAWTFSGLFNYKMANQLTNADKPSLITALACYTTYFDDPTTDTLGHQLLLGGNYGAVAIQGATTLADYVQNGEMAGRVVATMLREGVTLGVAIQESRQAMLDEGRRDVAVGWQCNCDPTLVLSPKGVPEPPQPEVYDGPS